MQETGKQWLIVGLGNPGPKYENNRHNAGRIVVTALANSVGATFSNHRSLAYVAKGRIGTLQGGRPGPAVLIAYPNSYMNLSGHAVANLSQFYNIKPDHILVVHDELDLDPHTLRLKRGGGEGGHNGLRSISKELGTKDFNRLRFGVGRPPGRMDPAAYVLSDFPSKELDEWALSVRLAVETLENVVTLGFESAQRTLHSA